jgi:hypothetical protein
MMMQHYLGSGDIEVYLKELVTTGDYDAAQAAFDNSILTRLRKKNPKAVLPKNKPVKEYLNNFIEKLDALPPVEKIEAISAVTGNPMPPVRKSNVVEKKQEPKVVVKPTPAVVTPKVTPKVEPAKEEEIKKLSRQEIAAVVEEKFKIKPTEKQLDILTNPNISVIEKAEQLGLVNLDPLFSEDAISNVQSWANRALVKKGLKDPDETEAVKTVIEYKSNVKNSGVNFLGEVKGKNSTFATFYNKFDRNVGFAYVPIANVGKSNSETTYNNVRGIAHFILDSSATDDYKHKYSQNYMLMQLKNINIAAGSTVVDQYLPTREKLKNGNVLVKYKKVSELAKDDYIMAPLRQYSYSDINWEGKTSAEGFASSIAALPTKTGEQTYFIFPNITGGKDTYGKFGGGSVVYLANGKEFAIDFAGSINDIKKMAQKIIAEEGIKEKDLIIAYHDLGSFSAKPKARGNNTLNFTQWSGFNTLGYTGGGLAFPSQ